MSYSYRFGRHQIEFTPLQEEMNAPVVYAARIVPALSGKTVYGYGTTEAEAAVDLLRVKRDKDSG